MRFLKQSHSAEKLERGTLWRQKNFEKKSHSAEKKMKEWHSAAKKIARKSFWLKQGLEPVTAGFTVNLVLTSTCEREKSVKSGTYAMRSDEKN